MDLSESTKNFWKKLKVGDIIGLQDKQAIEDQMDEGKTLGETYTVRSIKTFKAEGEHGCLAEFLLVEMDKEEETLYLSIKLVDKDVTLRVFYEAEEFEQGNREDILAREEEWLFKEPEDTNDFDPGDLEYASSIIQNIDDEDVEFTQLPQGELHGSCTVVPEETGVGNVFMTLVEYSTDVDCDNPYMLVIEEEVIDCCEEDEDGKEYEDNGYETENEWDGYDGYDGDGDDDYEDEDDDEEGGLITLYLGSDLSPLDINVYPVSRC